MTVFTENRRARVPFAVRLHVRHSFRPRSVLVASRRGGSRAGLSPEDACMCEPRPAPAPSNDGHSVSHRQLNVRETRVHPS